MNLEDDNDDDVDDNVADNAGQGPEGGNHDRRCYQPRHPGGDAARSHDHDPCRRSPGDFFASRVIFLACLDTETKPWEYYFGGR